MRRSGSLLAAIAGWVIVLLLVFVGIGCAGVVAGAIGVAVVPDLDAQLRNAIGGNAPTQAQLLALLAAVAGFLALLVALLVRLRRVLVTVQRGNPFDPSNPRNLYWVAGLLAASEIATNVIAWLAPQPALDHRGGPEFDLTPWLAVLVVLVLAEVFREGSRLRAEADLTV